MHEFIWILKNEWMNGDGHYIAEGQQINDINKWQLKNHHLIYHFVTMTEKNDSGKNQIDANIISKFDKKQEYLQS